MFCHDSTSIYYPTAPGRVYIIAITALADCDGSDEDYSDSTARGDLADMMNELDIVTIPHDLLGTRRIGSSEASYTSVGYWPPKWPTTTRGINDEGEEGIVEMSPQEVADDFADALEQWADWCDRDSVRLDSLDEIMGAIERAA